MPSPVLRWTFPVHEAGGEFSPNGTGAEAIASTAVTAPAVNIQHPHLHVSYRAQRCADLVIKTSVPKVRWRRGGGQGQIVTVV